MRHVAEGRIEKRAPTEPLWKDHSINISSELKGYPESDLEVTPSLDVQHFASAEASTYIAMINLMSKRLARL